MKIAEEWRELASYRLRVDELLKWIETIRLSAWKQGMTDAADSAFANGLHEMAIKLIAQRDANLGSEDLGAWEPKL